METIKVQTVDGVETKLYINIDGKFSVRVYDVDAGETVTVCWFPSMAGAERYYDKCIKG